VTVLELPVEYRYVTRGRRGSSYTLGVSGWPDVRAGRSLNVRRSLYDAAPEGSCLEVRWRIGYYGDPWVESWTPRPSCSKGRAGRDPAAAPDGEYARLMREVYRHFQDRKWAEALVTARRVTLLRPDDARTLQVAGYAARRAGDHAAAVVLLAKAVTLDPRAGAIWRDLGQAQMRLGRFEAAEQSLTRALLLFPIDAQALTDRAALRVRREDPAAALVDARRACELGDRQGCAIAKEIEGR
jgi:tetratricopeptide (TPR) repeat protein